MNILKKNKAKSKNPLKNAVISVASRNESNKPGWNDNINNLDKYKLSSADLVILLVYLVKKENQFDFKKFNRGQKRIT